MYNVDLEFPLRICPLCQLHLEMNENYFMTLEDELSGQMNARLKVMFSGNLRGLFKIVAQTISKLSIMLLNYRC